MENNFNHINDNNEELALMRQQLNELKSHIDRTTTLNEGLMLESIKNKMRSVHCSIYRVIALGCVAIPLWVGIGFYWNLPWYFTAFTIVMLTASFTADYIINHMDINTMDCNMAETAQRLVKMKRHRNIQISVAFPILILWLAWFFWELSKSIPNDTEFKAMIIGCVVGGVIGAAVGLSIFFKLQRANDEMIAQIKDLNS